MQAAVLVRIAVKDGTSRATLVDAIQESIQIDLDNENNECIESVELVPNSVLVYSPEHGGIVIYQP